MWSFMLVVCRVFFSTVSGGQIYPSNEVQSVALNSDFHKNWTIQPAPNEEAKSIILYYHSGEKDPKVAWHGSVTKLGKSTFNGSLNVNIIENTEVVVEFSNIQEAMVLYLMVHFVDDKSGEMHAFYSNVKIVLKVNGEWANWGSWNACSLTCNTGKQTRRRRCTDPSPENGGIDCRGLKIETKNCFIRRCVPVGYAKVTVQPICYKPSYRSPALFRLPMTGKISSIKLEHVSGYISCSIRKEKSYWACGCCYHSTSVLTLITDAKDNPQFPVQNYETRVGHKEFTVPGFNQMSKFLVLPAPKEDPLYYGRKDEVLKVWFGEDFVSWATTDNSGEHCVHVWVNYQ
ncbi:uncharacterized protein [Clytia hemisphaerica]|uniref:Uncharacterized protein n=1 Tax=Clytia hemisphaerica TaxID=252671 RepID=A0A7M5VAB3_9CNID